MEAYKAISFALLAALATSSLADDAVGLLRVDAGTNGVVETEMPFSPIGDSGPLGYVSGAFLGDALPDEWEWRNLGSLGRDGTGDLDGDGLSDFDENGHCTIRFIRARGVKTSVCHTTRTYQDGKLIYKNR